MRTLTLLEVEAEVDRRAALIGASGHESLPTYGRTEDFARPHVEVDSSGYHLVVVERGQEDSRATTRDIDELLYNIFANVTFSLASSYELAHRAEDRDCRRLIFRRQIELLSRLSPGWAARAAQEQDRILRNCPFDDMAGLRAELTRKLREAGHSAETAWQFACERYPLPHVP